MNDILIEALQNRHLYTHPVKTFKVLQTHISWVILTGDFAYKIKKPVNFGFLDYTALEARKEFCEKEYLFNKELAASLYLEVVPIFGRPDQPTFNPEGPPIEYALKMHQFRQSELFSQRIKHSTLTSDLLDTVVSQIVDFHHKTKLSADPHWGEPATVHAPVAANFTEIRPLLESPEDMQQLERLSAWAESEYQRLYARLSDRYEKGFIRECHGDLHLGNITVFNNKPLIFDRIEFNEAFRNTDTMADLGFLYMDLLDKERPDFANRVINRYFGKSGDYESVPLLRYYSAYRAMVRAKVALLEKNPKNYARYTQLAQQFSHPPQPFLLITHGLSGAGKSHLSEWLSAEMGAIILQSDRERKRLYAQPLDRSPTLEEKETLYSADATAKTYQALLTYARIALQAHFPVVVDATFLQAAHRKLFSKLARQYLCPFLIADLQLPLETIQAQLQARKTTISDADLSILEQQRAGQEPLTAKERLHAITLNSLDTHAKEKLLTTCRNHSKQLAGTS